MQPNETLANAFIFNAFLNNALQAAVCQYMLESMTDYAKGSNALLMAYKIKYSTSMIYYKEKVNMFTFALLFFSFVTLISLIIKGAGRMNFSEITNVVTGKKKQDGKDKKKGTSEELIKT